MSWLESPDCLGCQAGFSFWYLSAGGDVFPCDFVPLSFGNLRELGFEEIRRRMQQLLRHPSTTCLACAMRERYGEGVDGPLPWQSTQALLRHYDPGPSPKLLRYLCHDRKHAC
jgi:MoaA/NifB/PqqE/SkfB family radical SAM enzyme